MSYRLTLQQVEALRSCLSSPPDEVNCESAWFRDLCADVDSLAEVMRAAGQRYCYIYGRPDVC